MSYILHLDTSTDNSLVALSRSGLIISSVESKGTRDHARTINTSIQQVTDEAGITLAGVSAIAVCGGPGSYTGLRIGMATAKGICYAADKPLMNHNKLTLLAWQAARRHPGYSKYVVVLVAREREYFIAAYDRDFNCIAEPQHISEDSLSNIVSDKQLFIISDVTAEIFENLGLTDYSVNNNCEIDKNLWSVYASEKYDCNSIVNLSAAEPFYLKQVYTHK
jgi:tRNA threonylcarbamoyladenosine biosynthesis protein TsaB